MNHAIFYGTTFDRDEYKKVIIDALPDSWNVAIASRFREIGVRQRSNVKVEYIYDHPVFSKELSRKQVEDAERWLGVPFLHIFRCWIYWESKLETKEHLANVFEAMAKYVVFWRDFLERNKTELYTGNLESTYPEIIALEVARRLGLRIVNVNPGRLTNTYMMYDADFNCIFSKKVGKDEEVILKTLKQRYTNRKEPEYASLKKYGNEYVSTKHSASKLSAFMKYRRNYNSAEIFDKYRTAKPSKLFFDLLRQMYRNWCGKRLYKIPDYRKMKYFFYPLQLSKEAALTYMNPFIDQFALIEDIAKALPAGTKLIVKPHGHWRCADIPIDVISKFAKNKDIIMVDPDADTYDLIRNSTAVLTIESTVGFEALVLGKEVVCFGNAFYAQDGIVHKLKRIDGLPLLLKNISEGKSKTDTNKIIKFITTYYKNLIFLEGDIGSYYMLTENDGKNIVDTLKKVVGE